MKFGEQGLAPVPQRHPIGDSRGETAGSSNPRNLFHSEEAVERLKR